MYRIDDATAASSLPTPEAAATEGYFTEGNASAGTPATNVRASFLNMLQEELRAIVVAGGLTPSKTAYNQVLNAIKALGASGQLGNLPHGQCRLTVASSTTIQLSPYNGNNVIVNGVPLQLPSTGVSASNSGLIASAWYYVYLGGTTASPVLELSSTSYVTAANGVKVKSSDASRTLVGAIYTTSVGTNFADSPSQRFCLSYFNRQNKYMANAQSNLSFTNTALGEVSTALRCSFISWGDESVQTSSTGECQTNAGSISLTYQNLIDSQGGDFSGTWFTAGGVGNPFVSNNGSNVSEGAVHFTSLAAAVNSGTGTILQGYTRGMIRG